MVYLNFDWNLDVKDVKFNVILLYIFDSINKN